MNEHEPSKYIKIWDTLFSDNQLKKADFAMTKLPFLRGDCPEIGGVYRSLGDLTISTPVNPGVPFWLLQNPQGEVQRFFIQDLGLALDPWILGFFWGGKPMETPANFPVHVPIFDIVSVKICWFNMPTVPFTLS